MLKLRLIAAATAVSVAGLSAIALHEGKSNSAYPDPAHGWAVPTICIGHTAAVKRGQWRSDAECLDLLKQDAAIASGHVLRLAKVPLSQGELDAYTSLTFNIGEGNFARSTLLKQLNAGNRVAACDQILRWTYAGAVQLAGLVTRRKEEHDLCLRDIQSRPSMHS